MLSLIDVFENFPHGTHGLVMSADVEAFHDLLVATCQYVASRVRLPGIRAPV